MARDRHDRLGPDDPQTFVARGNLLRSIGRGGRPEEALLMAERLLADRERVLGPDHRETLQNARSHRAAPRDGWARRHGNRTPRGAARRPRARARSRGFRCAHELVQPGCHRRRVRSGRDRTALGLRRRNAGTSRRRSSGDSDRSGHPCGVPARSRPLRGRARSPRGAPR